MVSISKLKPQTPPQQNKVWCKQLKWWKYLKGGV